MYHTLENTHSAVTSSRRTIPTPLLNTPSADLRASSTGFHPGLNLRRKLNTARYVLFGTGKYAPPVGKFNV